MLKLRRRKAPQCLLSPPESLNQFMPGISTDNNQRVIVVSNRLPVMLRRTAAGWQSRKTAGGLATAMRPILQQNSGIWIGWSGEPAPPDPDATHTRILEGWEQKEGYFAVNLDAETVRGFYEGIANEVLWPLLHHFPSLLRFNPEHWKSYVKANEMFRDTVLKHLRPNDLVWIHDYHLFLLPQMLREAVADVRVGFFLHVPFPSSSVFRILPKREELLRGLLGADYLAFHTHRYLQNFRTSILRLLGLGSEMDRVEVGRRIVRLDALPIGIAPDQLSDLLTKNEGTKSYLTQLKSRYEHQKIIIGIDRLDYTKGIPERLRAYHRFLKDNPQWHGKVVLIQVAVPSRERVSNYARLRKEVDELVGQINGDWSSSDWSPVVYIRRGLPQSELAALYNAADVALVTPLRDGLNLVAKEYVACKPAGDGVLILSEFAGAAAEMGEALMVNPYDEESLSQAIERALSLSSVESRERMLALHRRVHRNNVFAWGTRFIENLTDAVGSRADRSRNEPVPLDHQAITRTFLKAKSRLVLLDYDGTLVPYTSLPQDAVPSATLLGLLHTLARLENTVVAIVSGRARPDLERWFGDVKNIWLAAEHGSVLRSPLSTYWEEPSLTVGRHWKARVYPILEHFVNRTPGSFIEEKEFSLVWHYRMSEPEFGDWLANDLVANLEQMLADSPVRAIKGQKTVEIKVVWANKSRLYSRLVPAIVKPDFILAAGDDATDEELFAHLPPNAWTIHVGRNRSRARHYVDGPDEMAGLLEQLINSMAANTEPREVEDEQNCDGPALALAGFVKTGHTESVPPGSR
jgi:trehalose 6-phosphate synthase/phosphatase